MRKEALANGQVYHVFTKSIAGYVIFNDQEEFNRMIEVIRYYHAEKPVIRFAKFQELSESKQRILNNQVTAEEESVETIAYCLMPTHLHLILKQTKDEGISKFMNNILNSYTRYFNKKHGRKGPLWESRFKNVLVKDDTQLLHLTRYVHLNPVTAFIVNDPKEWTNSSYQEYTGNSSERSFCRFTDIVDIKAEDYTSFVTDRVGYQRELAQIKHLILES